MAFTSAQLDALRDAYARGVTSVRHGDKTVTYASLEDMWRAIQRLERALASPTPPAYVRLTSKGY